jgi:hypothetical protein
VTERLIESGGKSAGTLADVAIDTGVGMATAGLVRGGSKVVQAIRAPKPPVAKAPVAQASPSDGTVDWYHGSLDVQTLRSQKFRTTNKYGDPVEPPFVCVTTDCRAAQNAIDPQVRYDAQFTDPEKLGIIQGRMNRTEWDQLHAEGHLRTNEYHGFDGRLQSTETKAVTVQGVDALNASMLEAK